MRDCFFNDCSDAEQYAHDECAMHLLIIIIIIIGTGSGREGPQPARGWCGANAILATITSRPSLEFLRALVVLLNLLQRFQTMLPENFCSRAFGISPLATVGDA